MPADPAKRRLRNKIPALMEALTGRFTEHHAFPVRLHPDRIDRLTTALDALAARIEAQIAPLPPAVEPPITIPGVDRHIAEVIVAETGGGMTVLPSADHPASRAGVAPGHREPAGKNKSGQTRPGNSHLKGAPGHRRQGPDHATRRAVGVLEALGYTVTLDRPDLEPAA